MYLLINSPDANSQVLGIANGPVMVCGWVNYMYKVGNEF